MSADVLGLAAGAAWFAAFLPAHVALLHASGGERPSQVLFGTAAAAMLAAALTVAIALPAGGSLLLGEVYAALTVSCLFVVYAPFFYTVYTSLSIQTSLHLAATGGEGRFDDLVDRFASRAVVEGRLGTMVASGYLVRDGEAFALTTKGRLVGAVFRWLKALWRLAPGG